MTTPDLQVLYGSDITDEHVKNNPFLKAYQHAYNKLDIGSTILLINGYVAGVIYEHNLRSEIEEMVCKFYKMGYAMGGWDRSYNRDPRKTPDELKKYFR